MAPVSWRIRGAPDPLTRPLVASIEHLAVSGSVGAGVYVQGNVDGTDLIVEDTASLAGSGHGGSALKAGTPAADVDLTRVRTRANREVSVFAFEQAEVTLHEASILESLARGCAETTCEDEPAGTGVGAYSGAVVVLDHAIVDGSAYCGLQVAAGADLDFLVREDAAPRGEVAHHPVAACLQVPGYDPLRVVTDVDYHDNVLDVDVEDRPIPDPDPGI